MKKEGKVIYENASAKSYVFYENIIDEKTKKHIGIIEITKGEKNAIQKSIIKKGYMKLC